MSMTAITIAATNAMIATMNTIDQSVWSSSDSSNLWFSSCSWSDELSNSSTSGADVAGLTSSLASSVLDSVSISFFSISGSTKLSTKEVLTKELFGSSVVVLVDVEVFDEAVDVNVKGLVIGCPTVELSKQLRSSLIFD